MDESNQVKTQVETQWWRTGSTTRRDDWQRGDNLLLLPLLVLRGPGVLKAPLRAASRMETHSNHFNIWWRSADQKYLLHEWQTFLQPVVPTFNFRKRFPTMPFHNTEEQIKPSGPRDNDMKKVTHGNKRDPSSDQREDATSATSLKVTGNQTGTRHRPAGASLTKQDAVQR